ncbi:nucleoside hydrolase [Pisolithus croceorrhizus]|nr:nucleoside hydrolase [Pisolithus croceorrhizus]
MTARKVPVIIDTDPGVDDILAILLALASPELEILAYVVSFGNTDVHAAYENIYRLYQAVGRQIASHPEDRARFPNFSPEVPPVLALGPHGPLEGGRHHAQYFHGRDGLGDVSQSHPDLNVHSEDRSSIFCANFITTTKSAVEVVLELLQSRPKRSITYIALGPLTGLALLLREHGDVLRENIGRVVIMGGALDVPGNATPVAEFNIYADAHAANEVLSIDTPERGLPSDRVVLLPLDITTIHELPFPLYVKHVDPTFESTRNPSVASAKSPLVHFSSSFFERTREVMIEFGKDVMELHDIVAIWCAIDNPPDPTETGDDLPVMSPGWAVAKRKFAIERTGELTVGMMVIDRRDDPTAYAPGLNRAQVQSLLEQYHQPHGLLESTAVPAQVETEDFVRPDSGTVSRTGIPCVVETPGPDALLRLLANRVWGVDL